MKKKLMLVAALMMMGIFVFAQGQNNDHHKHTGEKRVENMKKVLSLDENQYATIKGIDKKYGAKYGELRKDSTMAKDKKHEAIRGLRTEQQKEINGVLTPEQKTKWDGYKAQHVEKRKVHRQEAIQKREAQVKETLSLSDDQAAKMKNANKEFMDKLKAGKKDGQADKGAFKALRLEHETKVKAILSEEQFGKWKEMRKERRHKK